MSPLTRFAVRIIPQALVLVVTTLSSWGQENRLTPPPADVANLTGLTTPVEVTFADGGVARGSVFFYFQYGEDKETGPHWVKIERISLVTAKHLIKPKRLRHLQFFKYALRMSNNGEGAAWDVMTLDQQQLQHKLHLCRNERVDVAVVDVSDTIGEEGQKVLLQRSRILSFNGVDAEHSPGKSPILVQPGDDVLVIGYPNGIFDTFNKLPILKTGVLNTPIGMHFNGLDAFLLDFKYFAGLSGSLIISKPTRIWAGKGGGVQFGDTPNYVFLGVYQGEEIWNDVLPESADLGLGWYYYNVEDAINSALLVPITDGKGH